MPTDYDIAYSLNHQRTIRANSFEEAESKLKEQLKSEGVNLEVLELEIFDVNEEVVEEA